MSTIVNNNISALKANRYLGKANSGVSSAIERLSSGYRINTGKDDASGLVISEQLRSQISGLERASRNSSEAMNVISIAEGALNEMNEILKKLRALAIHAANSGVTSPEQVEADQAEMDSGLQTINRIANTTQYSDQNLLNGSKELVYDVKTVVNEPTDHALLNKTATQVDQIWKTKGVVMTIGHNGELSDSQANWTTSAQRAMLEADNAYAGCQIDGNSITADQKFILTGSSGSKQFSFTKGESLGQIVAGINNSADSTGVGATLIFASNVRIDNTASGGTAPVYPNTPGIGIGPFDDPAIPHAYSGGEIQIYGANINDPAKCAITSILITPDAANSFIAGENCDGDGRIYAKVIDVATNSIEYYKDADCTMLIGTGNEGFFSPANNSGIPGSPTATLDGIFIDLSDNNAQNHDVYTIALVGQQMNNQKDMDVQLSGWVDTENSVISGVQLGVNTDVDGTLHFKYTPETVDEYNNVLTYRVDVFNSSDYNSGNLVATSGTIVAIDVDDATVYDPASGLCDYAQKSITVESVTMLNGKDSNLNITLNVPTDALLATAGLPNAIQTGTTSFTNLGVRLYATEYGADEYIRIQNQEGELFYYYDAANTLSRTMIKGEDTVMRYGQDALVTLNGSALLTNGMRVRAATADFAGTLVFNEGSLGLTTIGVAGYDTGSLYSRAQALQALQENEVNIIKNDRYFIPMCVNDTVTNLKDAYTNDVSIYLDFSCLSDAVKDAIDVKDTDTNIDIDWDATTSELTISVTGLTTGTPTILEWTYSNINVENLANGFYVTDTALKGLYIKSSAVIDLDESVAAGNGDNSADQSTVRATAGDTLTEVMTYATNPRCSTSETMSNFQGGMQFQLGNTSGDQDRTVYSIQSMDLANVGQIQIDGEWYNLSNVQGGGIASLDRDPILAMKILEAAVDDVTNLRARLGAFQANMLQTNINSLDVAIENITLTESAIRDTDMADESTAFTKFQIMSQASTSMLAQANQLSQNVLSLLQ